MAFDKPHADESYLISSYIYRKALIRKHQLHTTVQEYLAKMDHRGIPSVLAPRDGGVGGIPRGWVVDIQFADELDELLMDELYELGETMRRNEEGGEKQWFILKPGFAERAQGIRMFSTEDELWVGLGLLMPGGRFMKSLSRNLRTRRRRTTTSQTRRKDLTSTTTKQACSPPSSVTLSSRSTSPDRFSLTWRKPPRPRQCWDIK